MFLQNIFRASIVACFLAYSFSAKATDFTVSDLSSTISDSATYDNVSVTNSRTLTSSSGYVYFGGTINTSFNLANTGTISSTGSNSDALYLPGLGNPSISVTNSGTISAAGSFGVAIYVPKSLNSFNFTLDNSGTISATNDYYGGIYLLSSSSGSYDITNSGTISNDHNGITLYGGDAVITNSGIIQAASTSDYAIYEENKLTLNILSGSNITGKIYGGGANVLNIKTDLSSANLNALTSTLEGGSWTKNFNGATLSIASGDTVSSIALSGNGAVANSGTLSALSASGSGNTLTLGSGSTTGNISNSGALSIGTGSSNIAYSNAISGTGSITKTGSGRLELSGTNTYSGATTVSAGELKVNGSASSSAVTVASGATISGTGTVGALTIQSGGTLAAGNSPGTLNVSGDLNLNSGSTTNFEFSSTTIDKIIASGNITIASGATANFNLYGADGYFTVSQDVLQTTGGTISGTFDTVSTDNGFTTNLSYSSTAVNATVSKTLNSSTLNGVLSSQNSVGRVISNSMVDQLRNSRYYDDKKTSAWVSGGGFGNYMQASGGSSAYSTNGYLASAGLISNYEDFQIVGGVFNSQANVKRYTYSGKDDVDTSGVAIGIGKNFQNPLGNLHAFSQLGAAFYNFTTKRNVNVNGAYQVGTGVGQGNFEYFSLGAAQTIPTKLKGQVEIFSTATLQKTQHNGWDESGLSSGNVSVSRSSLDTMNFEIGTSYKDDLPKFFHLPQNSFFKFELSGYKTNRYSRTNARVTDGSANYSVAPNYTQKLTWGGSAFFSVPVSENSTITAELDKRRNGSFREFVVVLGYKFGF